MFMATCWKGPWTPIGSWPLLMCWMETRLCIFVSLYLLTSLFIRWSVRFPWKETVDLGIENDRHIPTNSNGPEFLPELENHPFPVLGRNFSPRARFLVLQQNSEKHPRVDFRKIRAGIPGTRAGIPGNRARKNEELVFKQEFFSVQCCISTFEQNSEKHPRARILASGEIYPFGWNFLPVTKKAEITAWGFHRSECPDHPNFTKYIEVLKSTTTGWTSSKVPTASKTHHPACPL